ncbi:hypothetical protein ES705_13856 [subsurface metagenome]
MVVSFDIHCSPKDSMMKEHLSLSLSESNETVRVRPVFT